VNPPRPQGVPLGPFVPLRKQQRTAAIRPKAATHLGGPRLALREEVTGSVAMTCGYDGISRQAYYTWYCC
jgi:hypothetical protein